MALKWERVGAYNFPNHADVICACPSPPTVATGGRDRPDARDRRDQRAAGAGRLGDGGERGLRGARVPGAGARRVADGHDQGRRARRKVRSRQPGEHLDNNEIDI